MRQDQMDSGLDYIKMRMEIPTIVLTERMKILLLKPRNRWKILRGRKVGMKRLTIPAQIKDMRENITEDALEIGRTDAYVSFVNSF